MQKEVLVYAIAWNDIQEQDWPEDNTIFVCKDAQKRLFPECWNVAIMRDKAKGEDIIQLGLFWKKEDAVLFAKAKAGVV